MLTKSQLDQYIKDGQLVPIGTPCITIELGECEVEKHLANNAYGYKYKCVNKSGNFHSYHLDFKSNEIHFKTSLLDHTHPPPPKSNNPANPQLMKLTNVLMGWEVKMSKYIVTYVSGIAMQVAIKITENYTMGVIEAFLPDDNTLTPKEEKQWIKENNKRMKAICKFLNENNL